MVRVELLMGEMTARMHACTLNPQLSSDPTMRGRLNGGFWVAGLQQSNHCGIEGEKFDIIAHLEGKGREG
jgi:hypothetical protein